jgi:hypothetical protein
MAKGIFVQETTDVLGIGGEPATRYWIVATDDPTTAEQAVRKLVPRSPRVEATDIPVEPETMERLGLAPGQAWHL